MIYITLLCSTLILIPSAVIGVAEFEVLPSNKCPQPELESIKINFDKVSAYGRWNILYITDVDAFHDVDHAYHDFRTLSSHIYIENTTRVFKDKSRSMYITTLTFDDGKVIDETSDENGNILYFRYFPLFITDHKAALYLRCGDKRVGNSDADVRFISIPNSRTLTEDEEQQILEADRKFNFKGKLLKLPWEFSD